MPRSRPGAVPSLRDTTFVTEEFLPYLLNQTTNLWNRNLKRDLKRTAVNAKQWRVLAVLNRKPGSSLNELVAGTAIDQPTLSRMIDQLSALGLVKRDTAKDDARFLRLSLTAKGEKLVEAIWPIAWEHYRIGVAGLSAEEEKTLAKLLQRVLESLQGHDRA